MLMQIEKRKVVDPCNSCGKIEDDGFCTVYAWPDVQWARGKKCPMATHTKKEAVETKFVDPLKASKRKAKGK